MPSRPAVKPASSAFANLRPTILRQPARSAVSAESEARLLDTPAESGEALSIQAESIAEKLAAMRPGQNFAPMPAPAPAPVSSALPGQFSPAPPALLTRKRKPVLIPVTFRMPHPLKERLEQVAKLHEINQTDLINEAIELNLQRYV